MPYSIVTLLLTKTDWETFLIVSAKPRPPPPLTLKSLFVNRHVRSSSLYSCSSSSSWSAYLPLHFPIYAVLYCIIILVVVAIIKWVNFKGNHDYRRDYHIIVIINNKYGSRSISSAISQWIELLQISDLFIRHDEKMHVVEREKKLWKSIHFHKKTDNPFSQFFLIIMPNKTYVLLAILIMLIIVNVIISISHFSSKSQM